MQAYVVFTRAQRGVLGARRVLHGICLLRRRRAARLDEEILKHALEMECPRRFQRPAPLHLRREKTEPVIGRFAAVRRFVSNRR